MPRTTADRIDRSELPEFLRSKAIGAVIAEALDHQVHERGTGAIASLGAMVEDAAREIREFHGLPMPDQRTDPHRFGIVSHDESREAQA